MTLAGDVVTLEPLRREHVDALATAASDGRLWELWYTVGADPRGDGGGRRGRLAQQDDGRMLPFVVRRNDTGAVVGATTYCNVDAEVPAAGDRLHLDGGVGAAHRGQHRDASCCCSGTPSRCSAASRWSSARTGTTSSPGRRSPRLGAKQDGVLRNHRRLPDGSLRDTVVFSITDAEWPAVRTGLRSRLARHAR